MIITVSVIRIRDALPVQMDMLPSLLPPWTLLVTPCNNLNVYHALELMTSNVVTHSRPLKDSHSMSNNIRNPSELLNVGKILCGTTTFLWVQYVGP